MSYSSYGLANGNGGTPWIVHDVVQGWGWGWETQHIKVYNQNLWKESL